MLNNNDNDKITVGTPYFTSHASAVRYYLEYEGTRANSEAAVDRKLREGSIYIGLPPYQKGETLSIIDNGTRYAITSPRVMPHAMHCASRHSELCDCGVFK